MTHEATIELQGEKATHFTCFNSGSRQGEKARLPPSELPNLTRGQGYIHPRRALLLNNTSTGAITPSP